MCRYNFQCAGKDLAFNKVSGGMVWYCIVLYFIKITMDNLNKKLFDIFDLCNKANALTYLI